MAKTAGRQTSDASRRGITWREFCRAAFRLPGVEEGTSYSTPALFARKKLIARLKEDGETVAVRTDFLDRDVLLEADPRAFYLTDHYRAYPWVLMRLGGVRRTVAVELLDQAWRLAVGTAGSRPKPAKVKPRLSGASTRQREGTQRGGRRRRPTRVSGLLRQERK
jgi:hypothetical protein